MKYYIIAGERSGDLHAANLVRAIRQREPSATFRGFGGDYMAEQQVELTVHYRDLAFMGLVELLTNLMKIRKYLRLCRDDISKYNPDAIILVDYGGFNLQIARFGKRNGFRIFYYILPKYWAWWEKRALWLKPYVDHTFVILPFEKDFFNKFDWKSEYVGNPVLDAVKIHVPDEDFLVNNNLGQPYIAMLPGSRKQELLAIIPLLVGVANHFKNRNFAVAAVSNLDSALYNDLTALSNVKLIFEDTYNLLMNSTAAIVTSGTATLETALFRIPQIVVYKANPLSYWLAKQMIKIQFISLVNLIAKRQVVREILQSDANVKNVSDELERILIDQSYRANILQGYDDIIRILDTGSASDNTANLIIKYTKG